MQVGIGEGTSHAHKNYKNKDAKDLAHIGLGLKDALNLIDTYNVDDATLMGYRMIAWESGVGEQIAEKGAVRMLKIARQQQTPHKRGLGAIYDTFVISMDISIVFSPSTAEPRSATGTRVAPWTSLALEFPTLVI